MGLNEILRRTIARALASTWLVMEHEMSRAWKNICHQQ
jgi:hypothetical protein